MTVVDDSARIVYLECRGVSILVLVDDGRRRNDDEGDQENVRVSILVLVDDGRRRVRLAELAARWSGFNPCSCG